jgi:predicted enzyme related to lactoylglutathione lyase
MNNPRSSAMPRPNFIELPAADLGAAKSFYLGLFGWNLTDFGPTYSCTMTGDVDVGLQGDRQDAPPAPLPVVAVEDLEATLAAVTKLGGIVTRPIFSFPGGRRFHFRDPNGNELAAWTAE